MTHYIIGELKNILGVLGNVGIVAVIDFIIEASNRKMTVRDYIKEKRIFLPITCAIVVMIDTLCLLFGKSRVKLIIFAVLGLILFVLGCANKEKKYEKIRIFIYDIAVLILIASAHIWMME